LFVKIFSTWLIASKQNCRQKAFTMGASRSRGGLYVCAEYAWYWKFDKNCNDSYCSIFRFGVLGTMFGGLSPLRPPRGDGTASQFFHTVCAGDDAYIIGKIYNL